MRQDIKDVAEPLKIPFLVHFTRVTNLETIIKHGLYPKSRINEIGAIPQINDQHRHDGHLDSTSLSIGFPNGPMFYKYSQESGVKWAMLLMPASILWKKDCAFCRYNAATTYISTTPVDELKTTQAFLGMFEDDGTREDERLEPYDPTDVQAEVLVFDAIEPQYIKRAVFNDSGAMTSHAHLLGNCEPHLVSSRQWLFGSRGYSRKSR
jgi:hypothetical protein